MNQSETREHSLWYPYAQMKTMRPPLEVVSAKGVYLELSDGRRVIDAIASWWCVIHGYGHPELDAAIREQVGRMSHVMLGGLTHQPARRLADKLVEITPAGLNHVFFSDSGSVGVEVALKMAIQAWHNREEPDKKRIVALKKAYHGDTTGCMSVCDPDEGMHAIFRGLAPQQLFVGSPRGGYNADIATVLQDIQELAGVFKEHRGQIAALIVEPLLQAAGGFHVYSPEYVRLARQLCDEHGILLIFDEVATGFGRTGAMFAADKAGVCPDIMVLGKGLTAGYLGHAATLSTTDVFEAFWSDDRSRAFMHGPTFMGNPLACAVAVKSIEIFERDRYLERIVRMERLLGEQLLGFRSPLVREVRVLGAMGVIEVHDANCLRGVQEFALERGVWLRPFDRYLYTMPAYVIGDEELTQVTGVMKDWFEQTRG